jgi:hypothetical protein
LPAELPHALATLMGDCWQMDPANRPNFREIHSRLQRFLNTYSDASYSQLPDWCTYYSSPTSPGATQLARFNEMHALPAPSYSAGGHPLTMHGGMGMTMGASSIPASAGSAATWLHVNSSQSALASLLTAPSTSSSSPIPSSSTISSSLFHGPATSSSHGSVGVTASTTSLLHPSVIASLSGASTMASVAADDAQYLAHASSTPSKPRTPTLILPAGVAPATPPSTSPYDASDKLGISDSPPKVSTAPVAIAASAH